MNEIGTLSQHLSASIRGYLVEVKGCLFTNNQIIMTKKEDIGMRRAMAYLNAINSAKDDKDALSIATAILLGKGSKLKQYISETIFQHYEHIFNINSSYVDMFGITPESVVSTLSKNSFISVNKNDKAFIENIEKSISEAKATANFFKKDYKYTTDGISNKIIEFIESKKIEPDQTLSSKPTIHL